KRGILSLAIKKRSLLYIYFSYLCSVKRFSPGAHRICSTSAMRWSIFRQESELLLNDWCEPTWLWLGAHQLLRAQFQTRFLCPLRRGNERQRLPREPRNTCTHQGSFLGADD